MTMVNHKRPLHSIGRLMTYCWPWRPAKVTLNSFGQENPGRGWSASSMLGVGDWSKHVHEDETRCQELRFTPDGKRLITRHDSGKLLRWDTSAWKATTIIDSNTLRAFAISPDNRELAVGLQVEPQESRVDFYDMTSGELLRSHAVPNLRNGALRASRQPAVLS